tara:strand:- start:416 stop:520 length:105 start_codon:yes stop_codon:yes gene_type:complete
MEFIFPQAGESFAKIEEPEIVMGTEKIDLKIAQF